MDDTGLEALILAGGKGTRLRPLTIDVPKPMVPVADRPFLSYVLDEASRQGADRCVLSIGYRGHQIRDHFGDHHRGMPLSYVNEDKPLGTGGGIVNCLHAIEGDDFLVLNGDTFFQMDLRAFMSNHRQRGAEISVGLKQMYDFDRYGTVATSDDGRIVAFDEKKRVSEGLINAGVYAINRRLFERFPFPGAFSLELDLLRDHMQAILGYGDLHDGYFIDIGIPEDYQRAQTELPQVLGEG